VQEQLHFFAPTKKSPSFRKCYGMFGGDDGARTRDLCRDSEPETRKL
jgi:hypothetical protein